MSKSQEAMSLPDAMGDFPPVGYLRVRLNPLIGTMLVVDRSLANK